MKTLMLKGLAIAALLAAGSHAWAVGEMALTGEQSFEIDSKFRAKLAKEKVKMGFLQRESQRLQNAADGGADCGSQNIGNVNTGGTPGTAPREVFVFAPNAINFVGAGGCR